MRSVTVSELSGKRVVVTRSAEQADEFAALLTREGAISLFVPTIVLLPPEDWADVDRAIERIPKFDLAVFTSANGVRLFFDRYCDRTSAALPAGLKFAAIGAMTARALERYGVRTKAVPERPEAAEELAEHLARSFELRGKHVLLPGAAEIREVLPDALAEMGASVERVVVYRTAPSEKGKESLRKIAAEGWADWLTFASSSAVRGFVSLCDQLNLRARLTGAETHIAAIGRVTARQLEDFGVRVACIAREPTVEGMISAMKEYEREVRNET